MFWGVFCNCSHAAISSTLLCARMFVGPRAFYMNFTIRSIDDSLFGISCDVYSLKSLYDSLYNDKILFKLYVYVFCFVFCNCSHAVLPSVFAVRMSKWLGRAIVHVFLISYSRAGWCFRARAWVLHFQRLRS